MVTIKFEAEKLKGGQFIVLPTAVVIADNKNCFGIGLGWLKRVLTISISWS